jgi:hypothetical protein
MKVCPMGRRVRPDVRTGRLRAADPFELIRWLARSQTDPRKALAELAQNSLDARARTVTITRVRERGTATLRVLDDGEGVIPEMPRPEALAHVATHIGHSRKRNLTPEQRRGCCSRDSTASGSSVLVDRDRAELRSQVAGGEPWALRMWRRSRTSRSPAARAARLEGTWTEVIVRGLHRPAIVSLTGRRIGDYLAAELRGQLLDRDVAVTVHDRMARGRAQKVRRVEPVRFAGDRLALPATVPVLGHAPIRVELYLLPEGGEPGRVSVACGGTVVYDDVAQAFDGRLAHEPWSAGAWQASSTSPISRSRPARGAVCCWTPPPRRSPASSRPRSRRSCGSTSRAMRRDAPQPWKRTWSRSSRVRSGTWRARRRSTTSSPSAGASGRAERRSPPARDASSRRSPSPGGQRRSTLPRPPWRGRDRPGRARVGVSASACGPGERTSGAASAASRAHGPSQRSREIDAAGRPSRLPRRRSVGIALAVVARKDGREAAAEATVEVVEESKAGRRARHRACVRRGPRGEWRSRMADGRWEVNAGHRDFLSVEAAPRRKLRYLASLLAKEVVLHSYPMPQGGMLLERLVAVLTVTERRLERG